MYTGKTDPSLAAAAKAGLSSIRRSLLNHTIVLELPSIFYNSDPPLQFKRQQESLKTLRHEDTVLLGLSHKCPELFPYSKLDMDSIKLHQGIQLWDLGFGLSSSKNINSSKSCQITLEATKV